MNRRKGNSFGNRPLRGRRSGRSGNAIWYVLIFALIAVVSCVYYFATNSSRSTSIDHVTLCPANGGPVAITAILLDLTDPLTEAQRLRLLAYLDREIDESVVGTLFSVGIVSDDPVRWGASIAVCKPQEARDANELLQNPTLIGRRYEDKFRAPLQQTLDTMMSASEAKQSPIMEALQQLVAETPGFVTFRGPRTLVVVSDLLQNSEVASFYRGEDWSDFEASLHFQRLARTLERANITIFKVPRPLDGIRDPAAVEDFWARYFDIQGSLAPRFDILGDL